jgi:C_GCAxxG_C_C family probable redox protein
MSRVEETVARFREGCSCAQAVLSTYAPQFGMDRETALKVAAGFGGGMGRMADACGAVTAAFMVLGLKWGPATPADREAKERVYQLVREVAATFKARNGSIVCRDLLGCDISTDEGFELAKQRRLTSTICPEIVRDAAEVLEELLEA